MVLEELDYADPAIRAQQYFAVLDEQQSLCGFVQFFPIVGVTRLGLGLHPDRVGKGLGTAFVKLLVREAVARAPSNQIDLEVLIWNIRAQRTYMKAGFAITDTYERMTPNGLATFHCMVYS
ncbi:RimJ/RimL family protein N-acetyltransferase [Paenibacillus eucommiae]|uniref:RimJ/RimL family protein N-acetyltransferase n=2 Tax=Paenibacillus eucommiae TaxID=1355755 RepID=A0ABS4J4T5_9BACL|nr:RimJ/RimL family protein N-acetyltransferase [Paenibacillus eucommiae]